MNQLSKFSMKSDKTGTFLVYTLSQDDRFDSFSSTIIANNKNKLSGVMFFEYVQFESQRYFLWNITSLKTLKQFTEGKLNKLKVVTLFLSIITAVQNSLDVKLDFSKFVIHSDLIYVNPDSFTTNLVYLPLEGVSNQPFSLQLFLKELFFGLIIDQSENCDYVVLISKYLNKKTDFSLIELQQILLQIQMQMPKQKASSNPNNQAYPVSAPMQKPKTRNEGFFSSLFKKKVSQSNAPTPLSQPQALPQPPQAPQFQLFQPQPPQAPQFQPFQPQQPPQFQQPQPPLAPQFQPFQPQQPPKFQQPQAEQAPQFQQPQAEQTPQFQQPQTPQRIDSMTNPAATNSTDYNQNTGSPNNYPIRFKQDLDQTTLLETSIEELNAFASAPTPNAYLIRVKTQEKINITKNKFRLGKDQEQVDYCIENKTISRYHADILYRNGAFAIRDNHSTNGTYVNELLIGSDVETPLADHCKIILSDEFFDFFVQQ